MRARPLCLICLLIVVCTRLWAWRRSGDTETLGKQYQAAVEQAMAEAEK